MIPYGTVIVRRLPNSEVTTTCNRFWEASLFLIDKGVSLLDAVSISNEKGIFRGRISNMYDKKIPTGSIPQTDTV